MMILRKCSLTLVAAAFIGAYSLTHALIKRIRPKFQIQAQDTSAGGWYSLPKEIQSIILDNILVQLNDKQLLDLSLTCKQFEQRISDSDVWTRASHTLMLHAPGSYALAPHECARLGFSRKIAYFFQNKRLTVIGGSFGERKPPRKELPPLGYHSSGLYVPWLVNDFFKAPATFWKFLKTAIVDPVSFYKFLMQEDLYSSKAVTHIPTISRLGKHMKILGIMLSIMPWIDIFLAKSPIVAAIGSADSFKNFLEKIWSCDTLPIWNMMHMTLPLLFGALLDNVFYFSDLLPYQAILALITFLFNKGLKTALILSGTTFLPAILYQRFAPRNYLWWAPPWILMFLPLLFFNPITTLYFIVLIAAVLWDMAHRALRPQAQKMNFSKWFLLAATITAISAVVVAVMK